MNPIKASSLLHFTSKLSTLKSILRNGFRFSYAFEYYPRAVIYNELHPESPSELRIRDNSLIGIAMPMVCFCDIPLTRAYSHAKRYGEYILGIDKNVAITLYNGMLNPIHYSTSDKVSSALVDISVLKSWCKSYPNETDIQYPQTTVDGYNIKNVLSRIETKEEKYIFARNAINSINCLLSISKPYEGFDLDGKKVCYYDEQEWRIFIVDEEAEATNWIWNLESNSADEIKKRIALQNKTLHESKYAYLPITEKCQIELLSALITHIVVKKESQIPDLVNMLLHAEKVFGVNLQNRNKMHDKFKSLLISRVSSFERIENDF